MKVLVTTESRFHRTPDGAVWTVSTAGYEFWKRYLDVFEEVRVVGRMRDAAVAPQGSVRADGPGVILASISYYLGPWGYARKYFPLRREIGTLANTADAVIVRAPGMAGAIMVDELYKSGHPYGMEVVGDPWDVFSQGGVRTILRPLLRRRLTSDLKRQASGACAVAYVTAASLQKRYPALPGAHETAYSSIDLPDEAFTSQPRDLRPAPNPAKLVFVGTLEQLYKAPDILIDAVAIAVSHGANLQLNFVGEGKHRAELETRANNKGLGDQVRFIGHLKPGEAIWAQLDNADLFVLPSYQEGLPRAMIEAMARGLPCIGSNVGGIPELLTPAECVPAGDAQFLAEKMIEVLADPQRLADLSRANFAKARDYSYQILRPRRQALYQAVKDATTRWQAHPDRNPKNGKTRVFD